MTHAIHTTSAFWEFSLDIYSHAPCAQACLRWQEAYGADVNLLLYCLYRGARGDVLDGPCIAALDQAAMTWRQDAIEPLRALRIRLKNTDHAQDPARQALRVRVKGIELEAEHIAQQAIEAQAPAAAASEAPRAACRANLLAYADLLGASPAPDELDVLLPPWP